MLLNIALMNTCAVAPRPRLSRRVCACLCLESSSVDQLPGVSSCQTRSSQASPGQGQGYGARHLAYLEANTPKQGRANALDSWILDGEKARRPGAMHPGPAPRQSAPRPLVREEGPSCHQKIREASRAQEARGQRSWHQ